MIRIGFFITLLFVSFYALITVTAPSDAEITALAEANNWSHEYAKHKLTE